MRGRGAHHELIEAALDRHWPEHVERPDTGTTGNTTLTLVVVNERLSALEDARANGWLQSGRGSLTTLTCELTSMNSVAGRPPG